MRRAGLFVLLLALASAAARADHRALLIGIGRYQVDAAALPGVEADLAMMREVVRALGFADSQVEVLADSAATLAGIRAAIERSLVRGTTPADRALLYYSGHGTRIADASGDEDDGSDEVLLPHDFEEIVLARGERRLDNVLVDDDLGRLLARSPAREVVVLIDSCNSGTVTRSASAPLFKSKLYRYPGMPRGVQSSMLDPLLASAGSVILLGAAREDQDAQTTQQGALFTRGIHEAVRRAAAARHLTLDQLRREATRSIAHRIGARHDRLHQPTLYGNPDLGRLNLFLPDPADRTAAVTEEPDLWAELEMLVRDAGDSVPVTLGKSVYRPGESLALSVVAPGDGYVHVLNVGAGEDELMLLYPNRYQRDNRVRRGEVVRIPQSGRFRLPARLPSGHTLQDNLVAVIHTVRPLNLYDLRPSPAEAFRILRRGDLTRSVRKGYSATQLVVTVEK